eukprot:415686-Hanusia_phi.AAC.1
MVLMGQFQISNLQTSNDSYLTAKGEMDLLHKRAWLTQAYWSATAKFLQWASVGLTFNVAGAQGQIYHKIGSLLPQVGAIRGSSIKFMHLAFSMALLSSLNGSQISDLAQLLDGINRHVQLIRTRRSDEERGV